MKYSLLILLLLFINVALFAQEEAGRNLQEETMLHPADTFTGYTYKKGEWGYNQAITPYPSWGWWGITDWLTAELDIEAWLGGVPSFNFRFKLLEQEGARPALAYETMFQYLGEERDQFQNLDFLEINRQYSSWYNHINASWRMGEKWHLHLSAGATYADKISISNTDSLAPKGSSFTELLSPDYSLGLDYRFSHWATLHSTYSYGSTFLYADNIPRKQQFAIASRLAPFASSQKGFLNSFRLEVAVISVHFPDAGESFTGPIGFLYWQWQWKKKNEN